MRLTLRHNCVDARLDTLSVIVSTSQYVSYVTKLFKFASTKKMTCLSGCVHLDIMRTKCHIFIIDLEIGQEEIPVSFEE
jgi:hypothetical protein